MADRRPVGWYRLPRSGAPFYGPLPDDAAVCDPPGRLEAPARPARNASREAWLSYVAALDPGRAGQLQALTRGDLIDVVALLEQHGPDVVEDDSPVGPVVPGEQLAGDPAPDSGPDVDDPVDDPDRHLDTHEAEQ